MTLPTILAGPILRRTQLTYVWIWLCTSVEIDVSAKVYTVTPDHQIGSEVGQSTESKHIQLGPSLFVHMIKTAPLLARFDHSVTLAYRLFRPGSGGPEPLIENEAEFGVGNYRFPTFIIQDPRSDGLRALFGSCRKFHGPGEDASVGMLRYLREHLYPSPRHRQQPRPTALFLLGDQIYADDVSHLIIRNVARLGHELRPEELPDVEGRPDRLDLGVRQGIVSRFAGFTSNEAANHLMTLGEYAAMYLLAWNEQLWDPESMWPGFEELYSGVGGRSRGVPQRSFIPHWEEWRENLRDAKLGSAAMRKLLANIPTYMIFDDHDITDDWNLNPSWERHVFSKRLGKQIISNALVAYWAFQGWGNAPDAFSDNFLARIDEYRTHASHHTTNNIYVMLARNDGNLWSFRTPTKPAAVFLDFRTQRMANSRQDLEDVIFDLMITPLRVFEQGLLDHAIHASLLRVRRTRQAHLERLDLGPNRLNTMAPRLFNSPLRVRARRLMRPSRGQTLIVVTGTPVVGASMIDLGQEIKIDREGAFTWDFENWRGDPESLLDLYSLIRDTKPAVCAIISGDVHYGFAFKGRISWPDGVQISMGQYTSSSLKNRSFPPDFLLDFGARLAGRNVTNRWLYRGRAAADGTGVPTGRLLFGDPDHLSTLERNPTAYNTVLTQMGGVGGIFCDESWQMEQAVSRTFSGGFIRDTNFGALIASNQANMRLTVGMYNAQGELLGDVSRLGVLPRAERPLHGSFPPLESSHRTFRSIPRPEMMDAEIFARFCSHAYTRIGTPSPLPGWNVIDENISVDGTVIVHIDDLRNVTTGFNSRIYHNPQIHTYVLSFRGTEIEPLSIRDWVTNFRQAVWAYDRQYEQAMNVAWNFSRIPNARLVITGHSLGGGLASAAGAVTGLETFTFNASGVRSATIQARETPEQLRANERNIVAYYMEGEILTALQDGEIDVIYGLLLPSALGIRTRITAGDYRDAIRPLVPFSEEMVRMQLHSLDLVIGAIQAIRATVYGS